ncbi:glycosyltransferase involved in cell wall biosynthesis [Chromohalobacter marismortui]|uniref:Glycosyltransferase involved in cell wall biosynthesis n=2 Tax=Chromohalobacter marismortui TaxID=42055 RepID=A0A4R7NWI3_9GAMM|nr:MULTISPECIES: glycosyltransferase family 4 protein [Chromohalobacter]TDU25149.1 glycosyltransferase involved in cell wall biosynthesis [Chromohalobacter marismortui]
MKKRGKILLLSFYFPPDLGAGSFRSQALVEALMKQMPTGYALEVISTAPNRYAQYDSAAPEIETFDQGRLTVRRVDLPSHQSGMLDQSRAFLAYAWQVARLTRGQHYDLVIATSSRLMTGVLGRFVAGRASARLYLDIRDIFVENLPFLLPRGTQRLGIGFFSALERWAVRYAAKVNLVSPGFRGYFEQRFPDQVFTWHTNGVDPLFADGALQDAEHPQPATADVENAPGSAASRLRVLYAGNIGQCQGIDRILPTLAKRLENRVDFLLIGDGGRREALEAALSAEGVSNVEIRAPIARDQLIEQYRQADVLFLHLNDMFCFSRVIPSKLFEYAAMGKPIWAGVRAFPAEFCQAHINNTAVFEPCDAESALAAFETLAMALQPRQAFVERFHRDRIMREMADDALALIR